MEIALSHSFRVNSVKYPVSEGYAPCFDLSGFQPVLINIQQKC